MTTIAYRIDYNLIRSAKLRRTTITSLELAKQEIENMGKMNENRPDTYTNIKLLVASAGTT